MALKPDEEFVKKCLVKALGASKAYEGEDPPDIYLEFNGEKIAVEITRLSPVSFGERWDHSKSTFTRLFWPESL